MSANGHGVDLSKPTLNVEDLAELLGVAVWTLYQHVRVGDLPPELTPIRVGRCLRWPTSKVAAALALDGAAV